MACDGSDDEVALLTWRTAVGLFAECVGIHKVNGWALFDFLLSEKQLAMVTGRLGGASNT